MKFPVDINAVLIYIILRYLEIHYERITDETRFPIYAYEPFWFFH